MTGRNHELEVERYELSGPPAYLFAFERRTFLTIFGVLGSGLLVVEQNLGVATSLPERQLVMVTGSIAVETTAAELSADPAAQRRYLGVEPLPDAA